MTFSIKDALAGGGAFLTGAALLVGALAGEQAQPLDRTGVPNLNPFASSPPGFQCPAGWVRTEGSDPDAGASFTACENDRYIIKALDGGDPLAFDKASGRYLSVEDVR